MTVLTISVPTSVPRVLTPMTTLDLKSLGFTPGSCSRSKLSGTLNNLCILEPGIGLDYSV